MFSGPLVSLDTLTLTLDTLAEHYAKGGGRQDQVCLEYLGTNYSATNGSGGQDNVSIYYNETLLTVYSDIQLKGETKNYVYNSCIYIL